MILRPLFAALILALVSAPALAQAPASDQQAPSPAAMEASRDVARLLFVDSGIVSLALDRALAGQMPAARADITSRSFFRALPARDQQAVLAYFDTLPQIARQAIDETLPGLLETVATRTATVFDEEEIVGISAFLHSPHGRDVIMRLIRSEADGSTDDMALSGDEEAALFEFALTRAGAAFVAKADRWGQAISLTFREAAEELTPALRARIQRDICDVLRDRCPARLRRALTPI